MGVIVHDQAEWTPFGDGWLVRESADHKWEDALEPIPDEVLKAHLEKEIRQSSAQFTSQVSTLMRVLGMSEEQATLQATQPSASGTITSKEVG